MIVFSENDGQYSAGKTVRRSEKENATDERRNGKIQR